VLRFLENRHGWRGEVRISKRADRQDIHVRSSFSFPIKGCSTVGAEIEADLPSGLSISLENPCVAFDLDPGFREGSNAACKRSSPTLACLTVTYSDI
jgi:hypothetical protein